MRPLATVALLLLASASPAHYHMLIPDKPSAKKGEEVTITFQFGRTFESELSSMLAPRQVVLYALGQAGTDVTNKLEKVALKGVKGKVDGYRLKFKPDKRGDYVIEMVSAPTPLPDTKEVIQDTVKVIVHVQGQKGWDIGSSLDFGCAPMTRPYGLLPNAVFQAQYTGWGTPDEKNRARIPPNDNLMVEVERYNPTPPKVLPADEFITRTMKTNLNGEVTTNLPEAGWWSLTATRRGFEKATVGGKEVKVTCRAILWVHVDKTAPIKPPATEP